MSTWALYNYVLHAIPRKHVVHMQGAKQQAENTSSFPSDHHDRRNRQHGYPMNGALCTGHELSDVICGGVSLPYRLFTVTAAAIVIGGDSRDSLQADIMVRLYFKLGTNYKIPFSRDATAVVDCAIGSGYGAMPAAALIAVDASLW